MFREEKAIAVGWKELPVDPSKVSDEQLLAALKETYRCSDKKAMVAANQIKEFVDLKQDNMVLICRGYPPNQQKDVHIHGVARVAHFVTSHGGGAIGGSGTTL